MMAPPRSRPFPRPRALLQLLAAAALLLLLLLLLLLSPAPLRLGSSRAPLRVAVHGCWSDASGVLGEVWLLPRLTQRALGRALAPLPLSWLLPQWAQLLLADVVLICSYRPAREARALAARMRRSALTIYLASENEIGERNGFGDALLGAVDVSFGLRRDLELAPAQRERALAAPVVVAAAGWEDRHSGERGGHAEPHDRGRRGRSDGGRAPARTRDGAGGGGATRVSSSSGRPLIDDSEVCLAEAHEELPVAGARWRYRRLPWWLTESGGVGGGALDRDAPFPELRWAAALLPACRRDSSGASAEGGGKPPCRTGAPAAAAVAAAWRARPEPALLLSSHAAYPRALLCALAAEAAGGCRAMGAGLHNAEWPADVPAGRDARAKIALLARFRFDICPENSRASYQGGGYTTEKAVHAHLAGAVPLYWGDSPPDPLVFNAARYILLEDVRTDGAAAANATVVAALQALMRDPAAAEAWFAQPILAPSAHAWLAQWTASAVALLARAAEALEARKEGKCLN